MIRYADNPVSTHFFYEPLIVRSYRPSCEPHY